MCVIPRTCSVSNKDNNRFTRRYIFCRNRPTGVILLYTINIIFYFIINGHLYYCHVVLSAASMVVDLASALSSNGCYYIVYNISSENYCWTVNTYQPFSSNALNHIVSGDILLLYPSVQRSNHSRWPNCFSYVRQ